MQVVLYNNASDPMQLDKRLFLIGSAQATPYESLSVESPVLILSDKSISDLSKVNYMHIPELGRYYTASVSLGNNGLYVVSGSVDVWESFKEEILTIPAIVDRQEHAENCMTYINNGGYVSRVDNFMQRYTWSKGFSGTPQNILIAAGGGNY